MSQATHAELAARHGLGTVDLATHLQVSGWAWNPAAPDEPVELEILDGDERIALLRTGLHRPDLADLGMGRGHCGFHFTCGPTLLPRARHVLRVRRLDTGTDLTGSPAVLLREANGLDPSAAAFIAGCFASEAQSARSPAELDGALAFVVDQLGVLLRQRQALAEPVPDTVGEGLAELIDQATPAQWMTLAGRSMSAQYPPLTLPTSETPEVSVIIPVYGKFQLTYDCIASIRLALPERDFEVIVVDDASPDETVLAPLVLGAGVRVVRNERNLGFVKSCNRGAELARGEYLFFLNNDTLVKPGWLDQLVQTFERLPGVGVAGSKLVNGDGTLQESGGIIWRMGDGWNWGRGADPDEPRYCYLRDVDYVSGAALMIRRALFSSLGGFDLAFVPAYYEDTDLCFRVRQAGHRVVVQPLSVVVHLEGQTSGTSVTGRGMKQYQAINHRTFYRRWKDVLASHGADTGRPELEAERQVSKRAVFIDECVLTPDQDAGSNAALQHIRSLMRLGYKVTFIPADNLARPSPYTEALQAMGVEVIYHPFYWSVEEYFRKVNVAVDVVYLHRFANGAKYAGLVRRHQPGARLLYNVADLHHLRLQREAELTGDETVARQAAAVRLQELAAIESADATIVHSSVEQALLAGVLPQARVHVVPWAYPVRPVAAPAAQRQGVVFVGGYRHTPNVDAARWLVEVIMPLVWRRLPELTVSLVGSHMPDSLRRLASPRVRAVGQVPSLQPLYEQHLLSVAPLRFGAGVKGKVLEALAAGLPCVMTPCAAEGIALDGPLRRLVAEDAEAFAQQIIALHEDRGQADRVAAAGLALMQQQYGEASVDLALSAAIEPATQPNTAH